MISPTPPLAMSRRLGALTTVAVAVTLAGCAPTPAPTPTPTAAFASEEEAFAAAEATYRAYTDALNSVDFSDPSTFDAVYVLLSNASATSTRKIFSEFHAAKVRTVGLTEYDSFAGISADLSTGSISATVCVDVSAVDVVDESGKSIVLSDRPARQPMLISFEGTRGAGSVTIAAQDPADDFTCAR
ncbi:hypothetical protein [Microbacterium sp. SY138]|uniref:hypothetical protein n=1 Tax=Microbacterium sp. SY138 TaxID=3149040 RepID=UPI003218FFFB